MPMGKTRGAIPPAQGAHGCTWATRVPPTLIVSSTSSQPGSSWAGLALNFAAMGLRPGPSLLSNMRPSDRKPWYLTITSCPGRGDPPLPSLTSKYLTPDSVTPTADFGTAVLATAALGPDVAVVAAAAAAPSRTSRRAATGLAAGTSAAAHHSGSVASTTSITRRSRDPLGAAEKRFPEGSSSTRVGLVFPSPRLFLIIGISAVKASNCRLRHAVRSAWFALGGWERARGPRSSPDALRQECGRRCF